MSAALNRHLKPESDAFVAAEKSEGRWLPPALCEACDTTEGRLVWHHYDYAKPRDVIPLCCPCHQMVHTGRLREPRTGRMYPKPPPRTKVAKGKGGPMRSMGKHLKNWRKDEGRSLKWAHEQIGVSLRTLKYWESGERVPRLDRFLALVGALGVPENVWLPAVHESGWLTADYRARLQRIADGTP